MNKWKYLRENSSKYFDSEKNTPLCEYLDVIFPGKEFVYDKIIPKDIQVARGGDDYKRFRPDARCEELSLIVEFDGVDHYKENSIIIADMLKDSYVFKLGYKVVRIPYWVQLSNINIKHYFDVDLDQEMCTLTSSFYDTPGHGIDTCIGSMSAGGVDRFLSQYHSLPDETQNIIKEDIYHCFGECSVPLRYMIAPSYLLDMLTHQGKTNES